MAKQSNEQSLYLSLGEVSILPRLSSNRTFRNREAEWESLWRQAKEAINAREHQQAIQYYTSLIENYPNDFHPADRAIFFHQRGQQHYALGKLSEALNDLTTAITLDSTDPLSYSARGNVHWHCGRDEAALKDFKKAIQYSSQTSQSENVENAWFFKCQAFVAYFEKRYEEALIYCNKTMALKKHTNFCVLRSHIYLQLGYLENARIDYDKALESWPSSKVVKNLKTALDAALARRINPNENPIPELDALTINNNNQNEGFNHQQIKDKLKASSNIEIKTQETKEFEKSEDMQSKSESLMSQEVTNSFCDIEDENKSDSSPQRKG